MKTSEMKLSDRKEMIREIFNEEEVVEIRAALSDRYENLIKMAQKEEKHGRRHDDHSWPQERLAILDGTDWRAGVISVFDPESPETKNGDLFDDQDDDLEETSTGSIVNRPPEYQNDPWDCPHTEILDETEEEVEAPTGTLYDRVLSVVCPTCTNHGLGAGDVCVSVGGNPRNGFHAIRLRVAVQDGVISPDEYDAAYELQTLGDETDGPEDAQPAEDELPWERVGMALTES